MMMEKESQARKTVPGTVSGWAFCPIFLAIVARTMMGDPNRGGGATFPGLAEYGGALIYLVALMLAVAQVVYFLLCARHREGRSGALTSAGFAALPLGLIAIESMSGR